MLSKKYYELIATTINNNLHDERDDMELMTYSFVHELCDVFKRDNVAFNKDRFIKACYKDK